MIYRENQQRGDGATPATDFPENTPLGLHEDKFQGTPITIHHPLGTFSRGQVGDRLPALSQSQCVFYSRGHGEICISQAQFRLQAGEKVIFTPVPTDNHFYTRHRLVGRVPGLYLYQRLGQMRVTDLFQVL